MQRFDRSRVRGNWIGLIITCLLAPFGLQAATVQVLWNANTEPDLSGYKVHYGTAAGLYSVIIDVGKVTQYTVDGLNVNDTYYFVVSAYDESGNESANSQEVSYRVEDTSPPTAIAAAEQSDKVKVTFNEPLEKTSSEMVSNYAINNGIVIQRAELQTDTKTVYLYTTQQANGSYILTINNVKDRATVPNTILSNTQITYTWQGGDQTPPVLAEAKLINETFLKLSFSEALNQSTALAISNYTISPSVSINNSGIENDYKVVYLSTGPHTPGQTYSIVAKNVKDAAGNTIAANSTKTYSLAVTDASPPVPIAARAQDATHVEVEFSEPVDLTTSQRTNSYAIASITVQSAVLSTDKRKVTLTTSAHGTGNFTLAVSGVADVSNNTMTSASQLSYSFTAPDTQAPRLESVNLSLVNLIEINFNEPVERTSAENRSNYTITPSIAITKMTLDVSQKMVTVITSNHTDGTYTIKVSNVKDLGGNLIDVNFSQKTYSYIAPDQTPPALSTAVLRGANLVELVFTESLDRLSAENKANYSIIGSNGGIAVQSVVLNGDSLNHVNLTTGNHTPGNSYTVLVTGVKDRANPPNAMTAQQRAYNFPLTDTAPPKLVSVTPKGDQCLYLDFDEAVDQTAAETISNYSITTPSPVQIISAALSVNKTRVILNTYPHQPGKNYTVVVNGIKDLASPPNTIAAPNNQQQYFIVSQDKTPPELQIADLLNDRTLRLTFNEPLDPTIAKIVGNYSIDNGISIQSVSLGQTFTEVFLNTTTHPRGNYIVTIRNLKDQASTPNVMAAEVKKSYSWQPQDNTPPSLKEPPKLVNSQTIELVFDEPLNPATVVRDNFTITSSLISISVDQAVLLIGGTRVQLSTSTHIPGNYSVNIKGLQDAYGGNTISPIAGAYSVEDKTGLSMIKAELNPKNFLKVSFNKTLDSATGQQKTNYVINNNIQVKQVLLTTSGSEVYIETTDHAPGQYTLTVNGICDASSAKNAIKPYSQINYTWNPPDTSGPVLVSAKLDYNNFVILSFDEALEEKTATTAENYKIEPAVQIKQAFLDASLKTVNLFTANHDPGTYRITVSNVRDRSFTSNVIKTKTNTAQYSYIPPDNSPPKLVVCELSTPMNLVLQFDETVSRETAENLANYTIDNGIKISNAYLTSELNKVILETTSPHQSRTTYTITISNLKDRALSPNVLSSPIVKTYLYSPADDVSPTLQYVKLQNSKWLQVVFSETVDQQSAQNLNNYKIDPSVEVLNASLDQTTLRTVNLETTDHMPGISYGIYVRNVKDRAPVPNVIASSTYQSYNLPMSGGLADNAPPAVARVEALSSSLIEIVYSKPVDQNTAENKNNYAIQDSVSVQSATLDTNLVKVRISTTPMRSGKVYRIQIMNIRDRASKPNVLSVAPAIQYVYSKGVSISHPSQSDYDFQMFGQGKKCYGDREWLIAQAPEALKQSIQIVTRNEDKISTEDEFLRFDLRGSATMYVAYDKRAQQIPSWLAEWKATGEQVVNSHSDVYAVYSKKSMGGRITLGGNKSSAGDNMYMVFVVPQSGSSTLLAGLNKTSYSIAQVDVGDTYYIDRTYTVSSIPDSLKDLLWIKTAYDDKISRDSEFLRFTLTENSKIYVVYDSRIGVLPEWLSGWNKEEGQVVDSRGFTFNVLSKSYPSGDVVLGNHFGAPEDNMYVVLLESAGAESMPGESIQPGYFTLYQNYPNPFNPKTAIQYTVHKNGHLKITVFNLMGQTVKVLVNKNFAAGTKGEAVWDGTDRTGKSVSSGMYFYRIEQDQFAKTRRMTLLK